MYNNKQLVSFGDSWARGSSLGPGEKPFGELLSEKLQCSEFLNYSHPASSINHLTVQLNNYLNKVNACQEDPTHSVALFFLTGQDRGMVFDEGTKLWMFQNPSGGFGGPGGNTELCKLTNQAFWKYIYSPELADVTTNTSIIALQSICKNFGITDYYITGWQPFTFWPAVNTKKIYKEGRVSCGQLVGYMTDSGFTTQNAGGSWNYPNQRGHQLIADELYEWITTSCETN